MPWYRLYLNLLNESKIESTKFGKVYVNPSKTTILYLIKKLRQLRGIVNTGDVFVWDAFHATHMDAYKELGVSPRMDENSFEFWMAANDVPYNELMSEWRSCFTSGSDFRYVVYNPDLDDAHETAMKHPIFSRYIT